MWNRMGKARMGLKGKIVTAMILAGLLPLLGFALANSYMVSQSMEASSFKQMSALRDTKKQQIEDYVDEVGRHLISLAENTMTIDAVDLMNMAFVDLPYNMTHYKQENDVYIQNLTSYYDNSFTADLFSKTGLKIETDSIVPTEKASLIAQRIFISDNENSFEMKDELSGPADDSRYSLLHGEYHPVFRSLLKRYGYADLYLTDATSGNVIYSVFKKPDFASSLTSGPFKDSNFADSFNQAVEGEVGKTYLSRYDSYLPSHNENAWFMSTPIKSGSSIIGVLSLQLAQDRIDSILSKGVGSDQDMTVYIVSMDKGLISHSNLDDDTSHEIDRHGLPADSDISFDTGNKLTVGVHGDDVLASYTPLGIENTDWILVIEEPIANIYSSIETLQKAGVIIALIGSIFIIGIAYLLARGVLRQLGSDPKELKTVADAIANERWSDVDSIATECKENVGVFKSMLKMKENIEARIEKEQNSAAENKRILQALDNVASSVVVTDADYNVIYNNKSFSKLVKAHREEFEPLVYKSESDDTQYKASETLQSEFKKIIAINTSNTALGNSELRYEDFHAKIYGSSVMSDTGDLLGNVFEWTDRTEGDFIEEEIQSIVNSAMEGDLSKRINTSDKTGFFQRLSVGINTLVDVNDKSLNEAIDSLSAIAGGDLSKPVESEYSGIFGKLSQDINTTIANLSEVVSKIGSSSDQVLDTSNQILTENKQLSTRTEMQTSKLKETSLSMEQIMSTVKKNAKNANMANEEASDAKVTAEKGATVVKQAVSAMDEISDSSKEIVDIIGVIDDIAFQTNLLALNAAVEAARAGDQGRGFAVVASEVRNLAGRSAVAAKEIKDLIQKSVNKVDEGSRLVNNSGETLEEIIESVKKVSNIVAEIATASSEQSDGIADVNKAVTTMDEMTQQNATMVFQATKSIESMKDQSIKLSELIGFFSDSKATETHLPDQGMEQFSEMPKVSMG